MGPRRTWSTGASRESPQKPWPLAMRITTGFYRKSRPFWRTWCRLFRVVLDTNVVVSALRSRRGTAYRLLMLLDDSRWQPYLSVPLALEYEDVLKRSFMRGA